MLELHNILHFLGHHYCTQKLETVKCMMSGPTLPEFNVVFFLNLFVLAFHTSIVFIFCSVVLFLLFFCFLTLYVLVHGSLVSGVLVDLTHSWQSVWSVTLTPQQVSYCPVRLKREIKCDILSVGEQHPSQCVKGYDDDTEFMQVYQRKIRFNSIYFSITQILLWAKLDIFFTK